MTAQLVGAIGLVCTAPAAYYIGTGRLSERAFILWMANWIFAGNQIHFVQLRIHSARATTFSEKLAHGRLFLLAQPVLLASLVVAAFWRVLPPLAIVAFLPATRSRDTVVFHKAGTSGCQKFRLVRNEARSCIWITACGCFHLLVTPSDAKGVG